VAGEEGEGGVPFACDVSLEFGVSLTIVLTVGHDDESVNMVWAVDCEKMDLRV
jgi:hypothetical protein